jgi:hypothetical protein
VRGDYFSPDVRELIATFLRHGVRFLLVGGEAVIYHGYPRLTGDVDFWFEQTAANASRLFIALTEFWSGRIPGVVAERELLEPNVVVQFGRPPHRIDLVSSIDGVTFDQAWRGHVEERLELEGESPVPLAIIGLADLVANKRAAGRHKDLDDVEHLAPLLDRPEGHRTDE